MRMAVPRPPHTGGPKRPPVAPNITPHSTVFLLLTVPPCRKDVAATVPFRPDPFSLTRVVVVPVVPILGMRRPAERAAGRCQQTAIGGRCESGEERHFTVHDTFVSSSPPSSEQPVRDLPHGVCADFSHPAEATDHQIMCGYCRLNGSSATSKESQITVIIRPPSMWITTSSGINSGDGSFQAYPERSSGVSFRLSFEISSTFESPANLTLHAREQLMWTNPTTRSVRSCVRAANLNQGQKVLSSTPMSRRAEIE